MSKTTPKKSPGTALEVVDAKYDNVVAFEMTAEVAAFANGFGVDLSGSLDDRASVAAEHMNRSQRHMLASGLLLSSIRAECAHGEFADIVLAHGFEARAAQRAMQYAQFILAQPDAERLRLIDMPRSKVMLLASADPEVIYAAMEGGLGKIEALTVRAMAQELADIKAALVDTQVQRNTAETEAAGLKKKLARSADRADSVPLVVADLRAEVLANGEKARLAIESMHAASREVMALIGGPAHDWADATLRLSFSQLAAARVQLDGVLNKFAGALPDQDVSKPLTLSYLSELEVQEAAEAFAVLAAVHSFEAADRAHKREKARPQGRGRPKGAPVAPT